MKSRHFSHVDSPLARAADDIARQHDGMSGFHLLGKGLDAFAARVLLADKAGKSIDAQYYLFHEDLTGNILLEHLLAAADRGVRVRLLIDDMDTKGRDQDFAALDSHPNFELRLFNPYANRSARVLEMLTRFGKATRRMHNKSFTVDGAVTVVGGRNVGNEYFSADPSIEFGDLDVLAAGPIAVEVSEVFDAYWNHDLAYPAASMAGESTGAAHLDVLRGRLQEIAANSRDSVYAERLRSSRLVEHLTTGQFPLHWGRAKVFADSPDKLLMSPEERSAHMGPALRAEIEDMTAEALIFSPYFVPGNDGVAWLTGLVDRGVRVRIVTNSLASNDVSVVHAGYSRYRKKLVEGGVELYEVKARSAPAAQSHEKHWGGSFRASLHAKTFVFDRSRLFIGSLNLDPRSALLNTEMGIVFDNAELASAITEWVDSSLPALAYQVRLDDDLDLQWLDHQPAGEIIHTSEPNTGLLKRLGLWFARLLPIEAQL